MSAPLQGLPIALERDVLCQTLLREFSGTPEEVVGLDEASGFTAWWAAMSAR
ncbi:MAG: hypothetical protein H7345_07575 [Rubritepida sp.]|nr:hypothetical protein [Rubritepida sp.]